MKLYNTKENPELTPDVIAYCNRNINECGDYYGQFYDDVLIDIDEKPVYFAYDENRRRVVSIIHSYQQFGQVIWSTDRNIAESVEAIKSVHAGTIFINCGDHPMRNSDLHATSYHASYNENVIYPAIANAGILTTDPDSVDTLRDWLEAKYMKPEEDWQNHIEYKWGSMDHNMLYDKELMDYPWYRNEFGHYAYISFHYLNWSHNSDHERYLFAMVGDKPIGCICVGKYEQYGYYGLSYIDVASPYKNNGVAKMMIHELAKRIPSDLPLLLSMESKEGQKCHIHECFKREKWPNAAVTQDEFDEMCRQNALNA